MKRLAPIAIFLGSFLSFGVQPLAGRTLLPIFGGMASVWVTCLAAFQMLLLGGYWYAHAFAGDERRAARRLPVHVALLVAAAAWLCAVAFWHRGLAEWAAALPAPAAGALLAVLLLVAAPYLLLSANASLVQVLAGGDYRLYAVSNAGSFAGLLAYPFLMELYLPVQAQWLALAGGTLAYAGLLWCGLRGRASGRAPEAVKTLSGRGSRAADRAPRAASLALWLLLPAAGCFILNATTAFLTSALTPMPLMWVYVLSLYLLTYVIGFTDRGSRLLPLWLALGLGAIGLAIRSMAATGDGTCRFAWNLAAGSALLLFAVTGLHAWLYRIRPRRERLTLFNLCLAVGGGAGGALSSLVCPLVFKSAVEYSVGLVLALALVLAGMGQWLSGTGLAWIRGVASRIGAAIRAEDAGIMRAFWCAACAAAALGTFWVVLQHRTVRAHVFMEGRTFYGAWCVSNEDIVNQYGKRYPVYAFTHGGTTHGLQPKDEVYRREPTSYFGPLGGGLAFVSNPRYAAGKPVRVGVVGLGIGTLAMYGREGDTFRFYEICPEVMRLAEEGPFDYLRTCRAKREMVLGDARKRLEEEDRRGDEKYDILVMDAFSGDSISMYLVSREAFALYRRRLKDDGVFAVNITNWNLDLMPVMKAAAKAMGMACEVAEQPLGLFTYPARWAIMYRTRPAFPKEAVFLRMDGVRDVELPTDDKGSLLPFVMFFGG